MIGLFVVLLSLLGQSNANAVTRTSVQSGNWSAPTTWGGTVPNDGDDAILATGTTVRLDVNSAKLNNVTLLGTLFGAGDTLFLLGSFTGTGVFNSDSSTVAYTNSLLQTLSAQSIGNYFNLLFGDSNYLAGSRALQRDINVSHDFTCDLRRSVGAKILGQGILTVGGSFVYVGDSTSWIGKIIMNDQTGDTIVRLRIAPSTKFSGPFLFPRIVIEKPDTSFVVKFGFPDSIGSIYGDSLYVGSSSTLPDTIIDVVSGTLDAGQGIISCAGSVRSSANGPFLNLAPGTRFRSCRSFSDSRQMPYDTTIVPYIICDSGSTFEYYGPPIGHPAPIDISYLANNLVSHSYATVWISNYAVAAFTYNPVLVASNFVIWPGGATSAGRTFGTLPSQQITIRGNVSNLNQGQSGGSDDGMTPASDQWIFDSPNHTSTWTGPGAMSSILVAPTTTLSIRFLSDTACDSLNFVDSVEEMGGKCGGRILGRIFTSGSLNDTTQPNTFGNIGLAITAGSEPTPGKTIIARTAGYAPPGIFNGSRASHTILRYFHVTPTDGPQSGLENRLAFSYNCSEINGTDLTRADFWRSSDGGNSWSRVGRSGSDATNNTIYLDTTCIGFPDLSNAFLWAISDQEVDFPLNATLDFFRGVRAPNAVTLSWKTYSESKSLGFELYRLDGADTSLVGSWRNDARLTSQSIYGADYVWTDSSTPKKTLRYTLSERSENGILQRLAECTVDSFISQSATVRIEPNPLSALQDIRLAVMGISGTTRVQLFDGLGREVINTLIDLKSETVTVPPNSELHAGAYFLKISQAGVSASTKLIVLSP